jgi:glycosyltransferase involved in cell wall biosynthesis
VTLQLLQESHGVITTNPEDAAAVKALLGPLSPGGSHHQPWLALIPIGPNIVPARDDIGDVAATRQALGIPGGAYLVGHFGLLNRTKGIETLFLALQQLLDAGLPLYLAMVGEELGASDPTNRAYRVKLRHLISELALEEHVRWTGYLPATAISRTLRALDCCVLPYTDGASYRRGTLLAALAHGLPVVTTTPPSEASPDDAKPALLPALRDGQHCRLVPPGDPQQLAIAIQELLEDTALRQRLSSGARSLAEAFSWGVIAR